MRRGEIRGYKFKPPDKERPVLILTRDSAVAYLNAVTVAPITSTIRGIPSEVVIGREHGMDKDCAINLDHLQTVPKRKIGATLATLSEDKMLEVGPAICFALGLDWLL